MSKVTLCRGLPASGKSTWAKEQVSLSKGKVKRVNKDDLRAMLDKSIFSKDSERFIGKIQQTIIWECLEEGFDVIIDDTNLSPKISNAHISFIESYKKLTGRYNIHLEVKTFDVPLEECLRRNELREKRIPKEHLIRMYDKYLANK